MDIRLQPELKDKHLTLYVPEELLAKLDAYTKKNSKPKKISRSQVVRFILENFFAGNFGETGILFGISDEKIARKHGRKSTKAKVKNS